MARVVNYCQYCVRPDCLIAVRVLNKLIVDVTVHEVMNTLVGLPFLKNKNPRSGESFLKTSETVSTETVCLVFFKIFIEVWKFEIIEQSQN